MNITARQVRRIIADLETAGLLQREERYHSHKGQTTNKYDLTGLVESLKKFEPEFRQVEEEAKSKRKAVRKRGGLKANLN